MKKRNSFYKKFKSAARDFENNRLIPPNFEETIQQLLGKLEDQGLMKDQIKDNIILILTKFCGNGFSLEDDDIADIVKMILDDDILVKYCANLKFRLSLENFKDAYIL